MPVIKVDSSVRDQQRVNLTTLTGSNTDDPVDSLISRVKNEYISDIQMTLKNLDTREILNAIGAIKDAKSINFFCVGTSCIAAKNSYLRFYRAGYKDICLQRPCRDGDLQHH